MSTLVALDPGLSGTGYAAYAVPATRPAMLQEYGPLLLVAGTWYPPAGSIEARATWLVETAVALLRGWRGPYWVAVEVHAVAQQYARHRARDRSGRGHMNAEAVAANRELCGWLAGGLCAVATVCRVPAAARKRHRTLVVTDVWPHLGQGQASAHARDAVYLGLRVLTGTRWLTDQGQP